MLPRTPDFAAAMYDREEKQIPGRRAAQGVKGRPFLEGLQVAD